MFSIVLHAFLLSIKLQPHVKSYYAFLKKNKTKNELKLFLKM